MLKICISFQGMSSYVDNQLKYLMCLKKSFVNLSHLSYLSYLFCHIYSE